MTDRDQLHLLSGAYALNALNATERARFEAFLSESPDARLEVAEMSETAILLGLSSRSVSPPPALKARLMAQLAHTPQLTPQPMAVVPSMADQDTIADVAVGGRAATRAQARWFRRPATVLVAAAAAAALFFGGNLLGLATAGSGFEQAQASQAASLAELSTADDLQKQFSDVAGGGRATLLFSPQLDRSAVVIDGLPALEAGKIYEAWYVDADGARAAGTFAAADSGKSWRVLEGDMADNDAVAITIEPAGGSDSPTTDPIVVLGNA